MTLRAAVQDDSHVFLSLTLGARRGRSKLSPFFLTGACQANFEGSSEGTACPQGCIPEPSEGLCAACQVDRDRAPREG